MDTQQITYNRAIDNLSYLVLNYSKPVQELLAYHNVFFKGNPSKKQLINEVIEQLKIGNGQFTSSLEKIMIRFSGQENDPFWGAIAKGALGIVGGLFKKKRSSSSGASTNAAATAAAQAAAAKRDMERRMAQMRAEQERERREAERRRRELEEQRRREAKEAKEKAEAAKKKTNMMLIIGGGVVVLVGIVLVVALKPKPQIPQYGQYPQMPPIQR